MTENSSDTEPAAHVYMIGRYSRHAELARRAAELGEVLGWHCTSRWIRGDHDHAGQGEEVGRRYAEEDVADLRAADVVVAFTEEPGAGGRNRGGRHVELGMALALNLRVIVVGPAENVFCLLPEVERYPSWEAFLGAEINARREAEAGLCPACLQPMPA